MGSLEHPSTERKGQRTTTATGYMNANPYYARDVWYNPNFDQGDASAAARSGIANVGGYNTIQTQEQVNEQQMTRGTSAMNTGMGHAGAFPHVSTRGGGTPIINNLRFRLAGDKWRSTGWRGQLSVSSGPNKAFGTGAGGRGQSSEDSTKEVYSTEETRRGTRAHFTDEVWNEAKGKFGQTWAGFKDLGGTGGTPHLQAQLGQMFVQTRSNVGFARRVKRGL